LHVPLAVVVIDAPSVARQALAPALTVTLPEGATTPLPAVTATVTPPAVQARPSPDSPASPPSSASRRPD
jgi:hypothetical protein